ncbi:MAG TPA: hypothetical protein VFI13_02585 [Gemmatimonadales bacterium]|nr:hypothetical protein [Gemmatimonadales bacterium]
MLPPNDARLTGLRCIEPGSGSSAGLVVAGTPLVVEMSLEAGSALFATGARFTVGVQAEGFDLGAGGRRTGRFGDAAWPDPVAELRFLLPGDATAALPDRLVGLAGFLRVNAALPYLVSALRGPDVFIVPAGGS